MNMKNLALQNTKILILAVIISLSATYAYAEWNNPTATPPGNNTPTPLNVSATNQAKAGALGADIFITGGGKGWSDLTYGGGWYMTDTSWIRAYGNKGIYTGGQISAGGNIMAWSNLAVNGSITLGGVSRNSWPGGSLDRRTANGNPASCGKANSGCGATSVAYCPAGYKIAGGGHVMTSISCNSEGEDQFVWFSTLTNSGEGWQARAACATVVAVANCLKIN